MKILHINHSDNIGGAAIATMRIVESLNSIGDSNKVLVRLKFTDDDCVVSMNSLLFARIVNSIRVRVGRFFMLAFGVDFSFTHSINVIPSGVLNQINQINPDIVHLHWIGHETMSIESIMRINRPVVWTLHDMWLMSGTEHVPESNDYKNGFFKSNMMSLFSKAKFDKWMWNRKNNLVRNKQIHVVAPSRWMFDKAKESEMLKNCDIDVIPNPLDIDFWKNGDKCQARSKIGLPMDKKIILFGLYGDVSVKNKGFDLLVDALNKVKIPYSEIVISIFGGDYNKISIYGMPVVSHGFIDNIDRMRDIYRSADVYVMPSRIESFGQTASESMACGVPVVAFSGTGVADFVVHKKTGWLAKAYNADDLANGIDYVLGTGGQIEDLSYQSRKSIENFCSYNIVSHKYKDVYEKAISLDKTLR